MQIFCSRGKGVGKWKGVANETQRRFLKLDGLSIGQYNSDRGFMWMSM